MNKHTGLYTGTNLSVDESTKEPLMNSFVGYVDAALARRGTRTIARAWNMLALRRGEVEGV